MSHCPRIAVKAPPPSSVDSRKRTHGDNTSLRAEFVLAVLEDGAGLGSCSGLWLDADDISEQVGWPQTGATAPAVPWKRLPSR